MPWRCVASDGGSEDGCMIGFRSTWFGEGKGREVRQGLDRNTLSDKISMFEPAAIY